MCIRDRYQRRVRDPSPLQMGDEAVDQFLERNRLAMGQAEESARRLRSTSLQFGGKLVVATDSQTPALSEAEAMTSGLRNTNFATNTEPGGREWLRDVGHDRETTLMEVARAALDDVDLRILKPGNIKALEQTSDSLKTQLHMQETAVADGEAACQRIQTHTMAIRLAGTTAAVDRTELEKNIVEWHLKESEENEQRTRRWLETALKKSEEMGSMLSEEALRLKEMHRADTSELEKRLEISDEERKMALQGTQRFEEECANTFKKLREEVSEANYERESVQTKLEYELGQNKLLREEVNLAKARLETVQQQVAALGSEKESAYLDAATTREQMAHTVLAKQEEKVARCEQVQNDKVRMESNLRQEIAALKKTNMRVLQEKVEIAARLQLAANEAAQAMTELTVATNQNTELKSILQSKEEEAARLKNDNDRCSKELSVASDDVINLRCELGSARRKLEAAQREVEELKATQHEPADFRIYNVPYTYNPATLPPAH
eukprot:TRINITY_DN2532_c0_g1_i1.p1 TRINITY_DN2532_c0_g1~~TRINITY_DN2532_c0_g1_i1.p1  ORF type:complete len:495 (+),score=134.09 TRINITY_DN2532_c0_g1_i1:100-1584(+)